MKAVKITLFALAGASILSVYSSLVYSAGQSDIKNHTEVHVFRGQDFGPYFGDCSDGPKGSMYCAIDTRQKIRDDP
jgi:hypothetical protein